MNRKIGAFLSYILMIFEVLSTLLLTPFIIRCLGQAEYGVYKLVVAINAYLLLLDLGVGNAIIRYISKYKTEKNREKERQFLAVATIFYIIIAIMAIIIGCVLIRLFPQIFAKGLSRSEVELGRIILGITMVNSAVTLGTTVYNNVLIAYEKFTISKMASIIQIIVRKVLTYIVLKIGLGSIGIVSVNLLMTILCRGYFMFYVFVNMRLKPLFKNIDLFFIKDIVTYSALILLQMIATQLNSTVDQILIGSLISSSAIILAVYGVGTQIVQYFQSVGSSINGVLMPGLVRLVETNGTSEKIMSEMIRIGRIIFMMLSLIWSIFLVNGKEFIALWVGNENMQAYFVALILMFAYIFVLTESIGTQILWAMNEHKEQAILKIAIVLLNIVFTVLLIRWNPLIGATIGTFLSLILGDVVVMNVIFKKKLGMNIVSYYTSLFKGILPSLSISSVVGVILHEIMPIGWTFLTIKVLIMIIVYGIAMLKFGMNKYERELFGSIIKKILAIGGR